MYNDNGRGHDHCGLCHPMSRLCIGGQGALASTRKNSGNYVSYVFGKRSSVYSSRLCIGAQRALASDRKWYNIEETWREMIERKCDFACFRVFYLYFLLICHFDFSTVFNGFSWRMC